MDKNNWILSLSFSLLSLLTHCHQEVLVHNTEDSQFLHYLNHQIQTHLIYSIHVSCIHYWNQASYLAMVDPVERSLWFPKASSPNHCVIFLLSSLHAAIHLSCDCYYSYYSNCRSYCYYYCHLWNSTHSGTTSSIRN